MNEIQLLKDNERRRSDPASVHGIQTASTLALNNSEERFAMAICVAGDGL